MENHQSFKQGSDRISFNIFKDHHVYSVDNGPEGLEKKGGGQEAMVFVQARDDRPGSGNGNSESRQA